MLSLYNAQNPQAQANKRRKLIVIQNERFSRVDFNSKVVLTGV